MKTNPTSLQTWLLGTTGALIVFYFIFDIQLSIISGIVLLAVWIVSFTLDIHSTFSKPGLFQYESNVLLVKLQNKTGTIPGSILLGSIELLLVFIASVFFGKGSVDFVSFCVIASCAGNFHLLWYCSNKKFAKNIITHHNA